MTTASRFVVMNPMRVKAYAQLVRLPNVFTAWADVGVGAFAAWALASDTPVKGSAYVWLLLASTCLYCGGMVFNDYFDYDQDYKERPHRPLPSGRIPRRQALRLGSLLLLGGLIFAGVAGAGTSGFSSLSTMIAAFLVVAILLYDGGMKATWAGPLLMGTCRFLNILLGFSPIGISWGIWPGVVVAAYVAGITWFARTEAKVSNRTTLKWATLVILLAIVSALAVPAIVRDLKPELSPSPFLPYLLVAHGFFVGIPAYHAIEQPVPSKVQAAVKRAIMGLVILDAALASAFSGTVGLTLMLLLVPALWLGRRIYST
ncbi:MAG: hypothetical protein KatS3mg105_1701 [Gemmatales bacterium]|nr:MAG: hypothetical protein KatS3mg105_1701 [Gemmatales bacterium]